MKTKLFVSGVIVSLFVFVMPLSAEPEYDRRTCKYAADWALKCIPASLDKISYFPICELSCDLTKEDYDPCPPGKQGDAEQCSLSDKESLEQLPAVSGGVAPVSKVKCYSYLGNASVIQYCLNKAKSKNCTNFVKTSQCRTSQVAPTPSPTATPMPTPGSTATSTPWPSYTPSSTPSSTPWR